MPSLSKKFNQLKQWTGEKIGSAEKTAFPEAYQQLEMETESRREGVDNILQAMNSYVKGDDGRRSTPIARLSKTILQQGKMHGDDSAYGSLMICMGTGLDHLSTHQNEFGNNAKNGIISELETLSENMKEFDRIRKKLDNRRLDFDAKQNKLAKGKKSTELEEEVAVAKEKYEETLGDSERMMQGFKEREEILMTSLMQFAKDQAKFYEKAAETARKLATELQESAPQTKPKSVTRKESPREVAITPEESVPRSKTSSSSNCPAEKVVALYDFDAENEDELSFKKGDIIVVVKKQHEGWWVGNFDGSTGAFPSNYVESVTKSEDSKPAAVKRNSKSVSSPTPSLNSNSSTKTSEKLVNLSSSTERLALDDNDDDNMPQQQQQMGFSYLPRMEPGTSLSSMLRTNTKKPVQPKSTPNESIHEAESEGMKECNECGCNDFTANVFKPKSCNNCFHIH